MVEMMVALMVLTVGIFATAGAFMVSLKVQATSNGRARATHVATEELESMAAIPYGDLGFETGQTGYRATFEASDTVVVADPGTAPTGTTTVEGQDYSVRRDITWAASGSTTQAFKRLIVQISWTDQVGSHSVRADGAMYPNGSEGVTATASSSPTSSPTPSAPGDPTGLSATAPVPTISTQLDLAWTTGSPAPTFWEVNYSSNGGATWNVATTTQPGATTTYALTGLSPSTTYDVRVRGVSDALTSGWATATGTTNAASTACTVPSVVVSPTTVDRKGNGKLKADLLVTANTSGTCTGLKVKYPPSPLLAMTGAGSTFTHTLDKDAYAWSAGSQTIYVYASDGITVLAQVGITVT